MSSAAKVRREERSKNFVQQMQDFQNDSINFFNKCSKPDKNGKCRHTQADIKWMILEMIWN